MKIVSQADPAKVWLELSPEQLAVLSNGLLNATDLMSDGADADRDHWFESEFRARVGCSRAQAHTLLGQLQAAFAPQAIQTAKKAHVYFIGAGPGAPELITVRGAQLLAACDLILYAGSLVPEAVLQYARPEAEKYDTAKLSLPEQIELYGRARHGGLQVARIHSGDPAIYGATAEQMRALRELDISYEVVPGVSSFTACAATLGAELTRPNVTQTIILTRASGRASPVPDAENLASLAVHRASLCIFLGGHQLTENVTELLKHYPPETPAALVQRASQPEERRHVATLGTLLGGLKLSEWALTTMLLVSPALGSVDELESFSRLYDPQYAHKFRRAEKVTGQETP